MSRNTRTSSAKTILLISLILPAVLLIIVCVLNQIDRSTKITTYDNEIPRSKFILTTPTPTPTPTPKPLTFEEMNKLYGPCVRIPVLYYHHIQSEDTAKQKNQTGLSVYSEKFRDQMQYLKNRGYNTASMLDIINFFNNQTVIPSKSLLLTFDDGYEDFYINAYPILRELNFKATVFLPTGLMNNYDYLNWSQIGEMNTSGLISFANHTWSHKSASVSKDVDQKEITTADGQLAEYGYNNPKVFAYPYGSVTGYVKDILTGLGYSLAFTTRGGNILCNQKRFDLPRIRMGNSLMSYYGF